MISHPMYLANAPGIINTISPFCGDTMNIHESIYEFLDQVNYSTNFKTATTDEKKIEIVSSFLCGRARDWYQKQDWTGKKYGSESETDSFAQLFLKQFLSAAVLYNLKTVYNQHKQATGEDTTISERKIKVVQEIRQGCTRE